MATNIQTIKSFPALIKYLRTELGWPVDEEDGENLYFEYDSEDLGLDEKSAVKVRSAKQLRPLVAGQPWGIFWIDFEPKKLPISVMRRILYQLVTRKRGGKANQATWNLDDLLFISAVGNEKADQREIAFAHFHQEYGDLPTLRVLGWDGADTPLKIDYVTKTLHETLRWPNNPRDADSWREQWSGAFRHKLGHVIKTADALSVQLAELARRIRDAAQTLMAHESERGRLRTLYKAFQTALIHDLTEEDFADTYAQTITYGLLTAAISRTDMSGGQQGTALVAENVTDMVPITNSFLREMLQTFLQINGRKDGIDFDELGIQDVVDLLRGDETDLPEILRDFGNRAPGEDPVIHFYEHFLSAYDKKLKVQRGVFYTPQPVVSYIVRSVHELLQGEFGLEDGLAATTTWGEMEKRLPELKRPNTVLPDSPFVTVLDPATGTATFLVEVIDVIYKTLTANWEKQHLTKTAQQAAWNEYVPKHLLPRLHGYELMMAPYAIAHMKIGLKLFETGYHFESDERARVYLTNALEEPSPLAEQNAANLFEALGHEAQAVNDVKRNAHFTVVVGNPPYSTLSLNMGTWIKNLVEVFRLVNGERIFEKGKRNHMQDDYVKFVRLGLFLLEQSGAGVMGLITNHSFLYSPTFRGMRNYILGRIAYGRILDLNGNAKRDDAKTHPGDQNVFDIQQGVAISILALNASPASTEQSVWHFEIFGSRQQKYDLLSGEETHIDFDKIVPTEPYYVFKPTNVGETSEYESWFKLDQIMPFGGTGVKTNRDDFVIDFTDEPIVNRMIIFRDPTISDTDAQELLNLKENYTWKIPKARRLFRQDERRDYLADIDYRPFDTRRIYYQKNVVYNPRFETMAQVRRGNLFLLGCRQQYDVGFRHIFVTRNMFECCLVSAKSREISSGFPLYVYPREMLGQHDLFSPTGAETRTHNFASKFVDALRGALKIGFVEDGEGNLTTSCGPEDVFHYFYSILHSPTYRSRYSEFLKTDFPRLPLTSNVELFRQLCSLGEELVSLHLLESPMLNKPITKFKSKGDNVVAKGYPKYQAGAVLVNATQEFEGVSEDVWEFHIGGYQVCEKWLKDRRGRELSADDIVHYQKIVVALKETIRLMGEVDAAIESHGGWPMK